MKKQATFKFYAVTDAPFVGAYKTGSFKEGEPVIMFSMDFFTETMSEIPPEERLEEFKDGLLQTLTHEFCHAMQEYLNKEYDEFEVDRIISLYKPSWNVVDQITKEDVDGQFSIQEFLQFMDEDNSADLEEFKNKINVMWMGFRNWMKSF